MHFAGLQCERAMRSRELRDCVISDLVSGGMPKKQAEDFVDGCVVDFEDELIFGKVESTPAGLFANERETP